MPTPKDDEGEKEYISRCMGSEEMNGKFPENEQRAAVCYAYFRNWEKTGDIHDSGKKEEGSAKMSAPQLHSLKGAEIFSVGTHNGLSFSEDDVLGIADAFTVLNLGARVPLKFGHNDEQPMTDGQPALGWVERVWVDGGKLLADFVGMPSVVFNAVKNGLYKHVSVELLQNYSRNGASHPWVLDAVALLGADIPAVRELKDLQALAMARTLPGVRFTRTAVFKSETRLFNGDRQPMSDIDTLKAQLEAAQAELANERKTAFSEKVAAHRSRVKEMLESAVRSKRIDPNVRERILNSRQFKADTDILSYWTENEVRSEIERSTRADFSTSNTGVISKMADSKVADLNGKSNAEALIFKAEAECVRVGAKLDDHDALIAATKRVFKADPSLARAYFADPQGNYKSDAV